MIISLTVVTVLAYLSLDFIKGVENVKFHHFNLKSSLKFSTQFQSNIPKVRRFKYLVAFLVLFSFGLLILSLIGATQTFKFQQKWDRPSAPPLGLEFVLLAIAIFALHFTILIIVDIIHKKFSHYELRSQIYKENMNLNVVSSYQPPARQTLHMRVPEIELPPPPSKF